MGGSKVSGISKPSYEGQLVYEDPALKLNINED